MRVLVCLLVCVGVAWGESGLCVTRSEITGLKDAGSCVFQESQEGVSVRVRVDASLALAPLWGDRRQVRVRQGNSHGLPAYQAFILDGWGTVVFHPQSVDTQVHLATNPTDKEWVCTVHFMTVPVVDPGGKFFFTGDFSQVLSIQKCE